MCGQAHLREWMTRDSQGAVVIYAISDEDWASGYASQKATPFFISNGNLFLTDAYPIIEH